MPMIVVKKFVVDTDDVDEAHDLTKPSSDKVATLEVGQIKPYADPNAAQQPPVVPGATPGAMNMKTGKPIPSQA